MCDNKELKATNRSTIRHIASRGSYDRAMVNAVIDEALVCHVGFVEDGAPIVIPASPWRIGDWIYLHGSPKSRLMEVFASGQTLCISMAFVDGLILARSAMRHSTDYRSVVLFGSGEVVTDPLEKAQALAALIDKLSPGRSAIVRPPNDKELLVTAVVRMKISEGSAKVRSAPPTESEQDADWSPWTGVVPLSLKAGLAVPQSAAEKLDGPILPEWLK